MAKNPVEYILSVDPDKAWTGWSLSWFIRLRGILASLSIDVAATFTSYSKLTWEYTVVIFTVTSCFVAFLIIMRSINLRELYTSMYIHNLCHYLRDEFDDMMEVMLQVDGKATYAEKYKHFHNDTADRIAIIFRKFLRDESINCAIRLAGRRSGQEVYTTVGRSKEMSPLREELSEPIPSDDGICSVLRQREKRGVYIIHDIKQAGEGVWLKTKTDDLDDVKTVMVAPINGHIDGERTMIGLLYITSRKDRFKAQHTDPVRGIADLLGLIYPQITGIAEADEL